MLISQNKNFLLYTPLFFQNLEIAIFNFIRDEKEQIKIKNYLN